MIDPAAIRVVPSGHLEALAAEAVGDSGPRPLDTPGGPGLFASRLRVDRWLIDRGVGFRVKPEPDARGRTVYVLAACPFDPAHADPDACVMQAVDGKLSAQCFHNGCAGRGWQSFKAAIGPPDPDHYDPPLTGNRAKPRTRPSPPGRDRPAPPAGDGPPTEAIPPGPGPGPPPRTVTIDPLGLSVADTMRSITDVLLAAGDCFRRADQVVRVAGPTITPVLSASELAGLLNRHAEVLVTAEDGLAFRPLPTAYANTWLNHPVETGRLPAVTLFTLNPVYTTDWRIAPPGFDPASGIFSAGPAVEPRAGTARLDALLTDFCFRTPGDRTNYVGMLLTALLMPHFVGAKPAVLFNGNQPGLGKSILAQMVALLREGRPAETATYNPNDEEFEKRLGAIVRRGATTVVIDNAKAGGRNPRIDSAVLERSITDPVLSFRLLGHSREIRAENSHLFCLTANSPDVSRDLVTRCVVVNLYHEGDPARRAFTLPDPEAYALDHRAELLGELIGMVERWRAAGSPRAVAHSRFNKKGWGPIVGGILAANGQTGFLANAARAAEELDETRREFADLVAVLTDHPQGTWTGSELAALAAREGLFAAEFRDASARAAATRMGILAGRFVGERFPLPDGRSAVFGRTTDRKGTAYRVAVESSMAE